MFSAKSKNTISLFLVAAFFIVKAVDLHRYEHLFFDTKDASHCEICDFLVSGNSLDLPVVADLMSGIRVYLSDMAARLVTTYKNPVVKSAFSVCYFNKPPPCFTIL